MKTVIVKNIEPLGENVLIEIDQIETKTESGLIISVSTPVSVNMRTATVRAVNKNSFLAPGDTVYIPGMNLMAAQVEVDGKEMYLVIERTIVARVNS